MTGILASTTTTVCCFYEEDSSSLCAVLSQGKTKEREREGELVMGNYLSTSSIRKLCNFVCDDAKNFPGHSLPSLLLGVIISGQAGSFLWLKVQKRSSPLVIDVSPFIWALT